jgi:DNA repair photolyase
VARWPDANVIEVASHSQIPELYGNAGNVDRWVRVKTETLVLGVKKSLTARPNGRSADWIATSTSNGCAMACAYCYVPRRKGYANPITVFTNIDPDHRLPPAACRAPRRQA